MRIGGLFEGYGGLSLGVMDVLGGEHVWYSEIEPAACRILEHRFPGVSNLGDVTEVDWSQVGSVDVLTGGFPCQDVSHAGKRAGLGGDGARSGLWVEMVAAVAALRPSLVVIENVAGLLSARAERSPDAAPCDLGPDYGDVGELGDRPLLRALGAVLGDLAEMRYDAWWCTVRAADAGAPHGRARVFVFAWPADTDRPGLEGREPARRHVVSARGAVADAPHYRRERGWSARSGWDGPANSRHAPADAAGSGWATGLNHDVPGRGQSDAEGGGAESATDASCPGTGWDGRAVPRAAAESGRARADIPALGDGGAEAGGLERVMGYSHHGDIPEARPDEALREVRGPAYPQAVREAAGGSGRVPASPVLRPELQQQQSGGGQERAPLASAAAEGAGLRGMRDDGGAACPPQGPESSEQLPGEPDDALWVMSSPASLAGGPCGANGSSTKSASDCGCPLWGHYAPAVHRWEMVTGRAAPRPTELSAKGLPRLSARAVEWLMGLPDGWVTDVPGVNRNAQLKALGNGVVPAQCALALGLFLNWHANELRKVA